MRGGRVVINIVGVNGDGSDARAHSATAERSYFDHVSAHATSQ